MISPSGSRLSKKDVSMSEALGLKIMVEREEDREGRKEKVLIGVVVVGRR